MGIEHMTYYNGETLQMDSINIDYVATITFNKFCDDDILFSITLERKSSRVFLEVVAPTMLLVVVSWVIKVPTPMSHRAPAVFGFLACPRSANATEGSYGPH